MSALAALIEEAQLKFLQENHVELSQGDIARRSGLSRQRISQLMTERPKTLLPHETIEALAKGLRVTYDLVLERALESSGYSVPDFFPEAARKGKSKKAKQQDEQGV